MCGVWCVVCGLPVGDGGELADALDEDAQGHGHVVPWGGSAWVSMVQYGRYAGPRVSHDTVLALSTYQYAQGHGHVLALSNDTVLDLPTYQPNNPSRCARTWPCLSNPSPPPASRGRWQRAQGTCVTKATKGIYQVTTGLLYTHCMVLQRQG